ncbi:MAG: 7-cyano-7-deazaguanine synthase QueC [Planctomycetota bacterium]|jgi:7-cyano-7-deazaguanine synthase|nr:MAG: 7-cyano-7-deazaguanine synthase QueC [Planctomycetota bacterium]RLS99368.1 MAG: 7-cyano-7-deazaguanine synthase QueC [Planctomycetota bacterium]
MKRAVILLSGGLDSATVLAWMRREGYACHALSFAYGQRHGVELSRATEIALALGAVEHKIAEFDLRAFGASALTADIAVPKDRDDASISHGVPITYVPARNTIFLAFALAYAETIGAGDIAIGVNAIDYSGYPDCRPEFIAAFERLANLATRAGAEGASNFTVHTPLQALSKAGIVKLALELGVPVGRTLSCYDPSLAGAPCGRCDACSLRRRGFAEAGAVDH